ncbi:hypothetical protein EUTSA_v10018463mg [Eutrema salsugineum]|uniref:Phorbol-ester/DAG-type domain-containing protein n=1 Tax=Eutrema salsugineum TaxID=72664 RepID=V4KNG1_EUTSA|nr:uncharacterized protein LOC18009056 [Eutrema salsugineum]ESQ28853.1 hypothetical protein EUTSA_v10018463mg [Eutrema salsugineum]
MAFHPKHFLDEYPFIIRDGVCDLCGNMVYIESSACYCPTCKSSFHKDCLTITYPKIHEHTLTFIHRENHFVCDACGSIHPDMINMFGCLQCNFFIHKKCIFLPKAIKLTRHPHRLSHTFCISDGKQHCGVCHKILNKCYGGYTCINKVCKYVIHSNCATDSQVWDGKDIEGEPEELVKSGFDLASLTEINGRMMRHFSHDHDLMNLSVDVEGESDQICQACILPIDYGKLLACKLCEFFLHDTCAHLPRKMEHLLHRHPLTLQVYDLNMEKGFFTCSTCNRDSCGFMYQCCQGDCVFQIDVRCASLVEPFIHSVHPHPLFLRQRNDPLFLRQNNDLLFQRQNCDGCHGYSRSFVDCRTCYFVLDLTCLTLPKLIKHKYDLHPLTLGHHTMLQEEFHMICDICEKVISKDKLLYSCHHCLFTLHVECTIGKNPYLKSGHWIKKYGLEINISSNNGPSRPTCRTCQHVCQDKLVFKKQDVCFCSKECIL